MKSTVHCFVFDTLADWEHGFAVTGINNTQFHQVPNAWQVKAVAPRREPVVTSGGLRIVPDIALDELAPSDSRMLILPGGDTWEEPAVTDGDIITAASMAPLEFAYHIYRRLDLYAPEVLEAW